MVAIRLLLSLPPLLLVAGTLVPGPGAWSVDHLAHLPGPLGLRLAWPLAALVLLWTPLLDRLGAWLVHRAEPALLGRRAVAYGLLPAVGMVVLGFARTATPLLGDGVLVTGLLAQGDPTHGFDFLAYHLHARLARLVGVTTLPQAVHLLAVTSTLTGGAYLAAAAWAGRRLARGPGDALLVWALLVLSAPVLLFAGYAECYAQLAVCLVMFLTSLLLAVEGRGRLVTAAAWFGAALFWHLNALLLAPLLLVVAVWPALARRTPRSGPRALPARLVTVAWPPLVALALAAGVLLLSGTGPAALLGQFGPARPGLPLLNPLTGPRGLLDWRLARDVANLAVLLTAVPLALWAAAAWARHRPGAPAACADTADTAADAPPGPPGALARAASRLLGAGAVLLLVVAWLLNLKLGVARDWDLLAAHAALVALAAAASWRRLAPDGRVRARALAAVVTVGLVLTVPWLAVNAREDAALARLTRIGADLPPYPRSLVWADRGRWHRERGEMDAALAAYRTASEILPRHARYHLLTGQILHAGRRHQEALWSLRRAMALDAENPLTREMLVRVLAALERPAEALVHARSLAADRTQTAALAALHGQLAEQAGEPAEAVAAYVRAVRQAPERTDLMVRIGELELAAGRSPRAEYAFRKALHQDGRLLGARLGLARAIWHQARTADADPARLQEVLALLADLERAGADTTALHSWRQAIDQQLARADAGVVPPDR